MARPRKNRSICSLPTNTKFGPVSGYSETVYMTVDEYECIRLIDHLGFNQEECSKQMDVARSTIAAIYLSAREKIADSLVNGKGLEINGGDVEICSKNGNCCGKCGKNKCGHCDHGSCLQCKYRGKDNANDSYKAE